MHWRLALGLLVIAACGKPSGNDAGPPDSGEPEDAGFDAGQQILTPRDAGDVITDSGLPWSWASVLPVITASPAPGTLGVRWVDVTPRPADRAWSGGVLLFDGGIVAIPFSESAALFIHPDTDTSERWPIDGGAVDEGWEGGVLLPSGVVLAFPRNAARFLRIDPATRAVEPFGVDLSDASDGGRDKFRGGVLGLNGLVYAAPASARYVARLDPTTGAVTKLPVPPPFEVGRTQGAVLLPTGDIVMLPGADQPGLLVVPSRDAGRDEVWLLPRPATPSGTAFAGGGVVTGVDSALAVPQQNAYPLAYEAGLLLWLSAVPGVERGAANSWYFAAWSTDGFIYAPPYGADGGVALRLARSGSAAVLDLDAGVTVFRAVRGAVALPDGRIIGIPHGRPSWLVLTPSGRRQATMEAMTSPYLNKL